MLKAKKDVNEPNQPPYSGWQFLNGRDFQSDEHLTCSSDPLSPCSIELSLSGAAKEKHGQCEGMYQSTGLMNMGRQVDII